MPVAEAATEAKWASTCKGCSRRIGVGESIFLWDGRWLCGSCNDRRSASPRLVVIETDWVDALFDAVPPEHLQRVYRALVVAFHPDTGGDLAVMQRINVAAERKGG